MAGPVLVFDSSKRPSSVRSSLDSVTRALESKIRRLAVEHPDDLAFIAELIDEYLDDLDALADRWQTKGARE